jgi:hypothetical protein
MAEARVKEFIQRWKKHWGQEHKLEHMRYHATSDYKQDRGFVPYWRNGCAKAQQGTRVLQ